MTPFRYPNITGRTPEERQAQLERWARQLVDQLNRELLGKADSTEKEATHNGG